jgi:hypothetical protein
MVKSCLQIFDDGCTVIYVKLMYNFTMSFDNLTRVLFSHSQLASKLAHVVSSRNLNTYESHIPRYIHLPDSTSHGKYWNSKTTCQ